MLRLLRFLRGYVCFAVSGRYPERFLNISLRNGVRLWGVKRQEGGLTACMYMRDYLHIRRCARGAGVRLRVCSRRGLPVCLRRYSNRAGLVIGAAAFVITVFVMSLFIWSVDITGLERLSESEMRALLCENGMYVGAFKPGLDYQGVSRKVMLADSRIGWMAVNVTGSYASVEVKEESPSPAVTDIDTPCNVKARRDGRILRIEAGQGTIVIKEGSGVVAGQPVVSGVMEDKLGGQRLVHAEARIIAETVYHAVFRIPDTVMCAVPTGESKRRLTAVLFGWRVPLTVGGVSTAEYLCDEREESPCPLDVRLPAGLVTRDIYAFRRKRIAPDNNSAKEILMNESRLYEAFTLSECTVTDRSCRMMHTDGAYTLTVDYTCTEDIACTDPIGVGPVR